MSYSNTFIRVAADCPVETGVIPVSSKPQLPAHIIQYELLADCPYRYTHEELLYEVHVRHKQIPEEERTSRRAELWAELFSKSIPASVPPCCPSAMAGVSIMMLRAGSPFTPWNPRNTTGLFPGQTAG